MEAILAHDLSLVLIQFPSQTSHMVSIGHLTHIKVPIQAQEIIPSCQVSASVYMSLETPNASVL